MFVINVLQYGVVVYHFFMGVHIQEDTMRSIRAYTHFQNLSAVEINDTFTSLERKMFLFLYKSYYDRAENNFTDWNQYY